MYLSLGKDSGNDLVFSRCRLRLPFTLFNWKLMEERIIVCCTIASFGSPELEKMLVATVLVKILHFCYILLSVIRYQNGKKCCLATVNPFSITCTFNESVAVKSL